MAEFTLPVRGLRLCLALVLGVSGCMNPMYTRFPGCQHSSPHAENMAWQRQDPFPDPDIGPSTLSAPRGYERPRTTPRRAAEQRLLQGIPVGPESVPPGVPQGGLRRPQAVN